MAELSTIYQACPAHFMLRGVLIPDEPRIITPPIRAAILAGRFEMEEAEAVPWIIRPGDVVLEVGAGLGFISTLLARQPGVRRVIAAEANPLLMNYMADLHAENGVHVERLHAVLTNEPRESLTFYLRHDFWMGSLLPGPNPYETTVEVPTRNLNELLRSKGVTMIVCDIEGAEAFFFADADLTSVERIFIELHDHVTGLKGIAALFTTLASRGFAYDPRHSNRAVVLFQKVAEDEIPRLYEG